MEHDPASMYHDTDLAEARNTSGVSRGRHFDTPSRMQALEGHHLLLPRGGHGWGDMERFAVVGVHQQLDVSHTGGRSSGFRCAWSFVP
jgi:hypothetical protein